MAIENNIEEAKLRIAGIMEKMALLRNAIADVRGGQPQDRRTGALNAGSWAYAIEQGITRLKALDRRDYEAQLQPEVTAYMSDPVVSWWMDIRGSAIHDVPPSFQNGTYIKSFNSSDMAILQAAAPSGTTSIFIGDNLGGSGYEVTDAEGYQTKIYFQLPIDIGYSWVNFDNPPNGRSLEDLAEELETATSALIKKASEWVARYE